MKGLARGGTPTHNLALSPEPQDSHSMQRDPKAQCPLAWVSSQLVAQQVAMCLEGGVGSTWVFTVQGPSQGQPSSDPQRCSHDSLELQASLTTHDQGTCSIHNPISSPSVTMRSPQYAGP